MHAMPEERVEGLLAQLPGAEAGDPLPLWARQLRQRGADVFGRHGFPHPRLEAWKYTSLKSLEQSLERLGSTGEDDAPAASLPAIDADAHVVMTNGVMADLRGRLPGGVQVLALEQALERGEDDLAALLGSLETEHPSRSLVALNDATLEAGLVLRVPAGVDAGRLAIDWHSSSGADRALCNSRVAVLLGDGARLRLVERHAAREDAESATALSLVCQVSLGAGAALDQARLQRLDPAATLLTLTDVRQAADSAYRHAGLDLGAALARHDIHTRLAGPGASCSLDGAYLPRGRSHVDVHLAVQHAAPECTSDQFYRGVVDDRARAVFNGRVHVLPGADGTEARQSNANLLASPLAEVNTKPELEIEADEVVASHGATVGQLDEVAVFYLRSRGLDEAAARALLTGAFCRAAVDRIADEDTRKLFGEALDAHLDEAPIAEIAP